MASDAFVEGVAGAAGAVTSLCLTYPLMRVSTLQATDRGSTKETTAALLAKILKHEGMEGIFRGIGPAVAGTAISQGIYFYLYSALKDAVAKLMKPDRGSHDANIGILPSILVATAAGCGNVLITNPVWLVVTRLQTAAAPHKPLQAAAKPLPTPDGKADPSADAAAQPAPEDKLTTLKVIADVYRNYGIGGFWKGVVPSLVMVCNPTVQYVVYEALCAQYRSSKRLKAGAKASKKAVQLTGLEVFGLSALAKLVATLTTYPLLVLKSRLQASRGSSQDPQYSGSWGATLQIYKEEGLGGFFKGLKTKVVQSVFAAALMFALKEKIYRTTKAMIK